ncbi:hypothetical protein [Parabacteroides gordonii]|jgi:hypothetical protein|uniref:Uncharacterized protein n=1 Tax=Parabacteroides gordonii MS-1 = DSM 23371 TaxID=1203610 RepID=A0A0F5J8C0_9BACT|nr:hypothetical protein [Parabacteroides gordonii]KKB54024.1 hypothetical protein HMPREF1536_03605 [Parabacteroides gordonii MS-1 = DSM 23371]MCA5584846.1 hypothetical protein [Parabacteroides gordonii]RGP14129.1 hypothetical protein DXB27_18130 [Parabacteroides gordonii]
MKKTKVLMLLLSFFVCGVCFATPQNMEEVTDGNNSSVASTTYKVSFIERSTTGQDVSVAGPFYMASYKDDTGSHDFNHDGIADVGANGVVSFYTYKESSQTVVQILVDNGRVTYVLGTSGGTYTLPPITSNTTITIIYQLGSGGN